MSFTNKVCVRPPMTLPQPEDSHEQLPFERAYSEDLLRREAFDWAEDVEEALASAAQAISIPSNMPSSPPARPFSPVPWMKRDTRSEIVSYSDGFDNSIPEAFPYDSHDLEPTPPPDFMRQFGFHTALPTIEEDEEHIDSSMSSEVQDTDSQTTSPTSSTDGTIPSNGEFTSQCASDAEEAAAAAQAEANLHYIFAERDLWMEIKKDIHHFNWMGMRTYTHCSTAPSESLAIMLSKPKSLQGSDKLRKQSVLNRAIQYIDPVIVRLDGPDDHVLDLRGSALARESQRRVLKFYTPHGTWMDDQRDLANTCFDIGSLKTYGVPRFAIGNGVVESSPIPPMHGLVEPDGEGSGEFESLPRKQTWKAKPSPLRQHQSAASFDGPPRRQRHITTCVHGAPSEVYTSFPTPVFGRQKGVKAIWKKAHNKLATAVSSLKGKRR
ncbi:hypothetical protein N7535_008869 [Penicillium sp. DV-2018c]|nr:hypothetical protein N7461_002625 [Penicillium sp. DV-2018c]KAJ5563705.1 hypothetical protein N7535_008869 [Penicillium sp. DV-2018c]